MKKNTYHTAVWTLFLTIATLLNSCSASHQLNCDAEQGAMQQGFTTKNEGEVGAAIQRGANLQASCYAYRPPLHRAAELGYLEEVTVLLDSGVSVDSRDNRGATPLHGAAREGHLEVVLRLLQRGATVDRQDKYGETPPHLAAYSGRTQVVQLLLQRGATVNRQDKYGQTPLMSAIHSYYAPSKLPLLKLLIEQPQNFYLTNNQGQTALKIAEEKFDKVTEPADKQFYSWVIASLKQQMSK